MEVVSDAQAQALVREGLAIEGLKNALMRQVWSPTSETLLACVQTLGADHNRDASMLVNAWLECSPDLALNHPQVALSLMQTMVELAFAHPFEPDWTARRVIDAVVAADHRLPLPPCEGDESPLMKAASRALGKQELAFIGAMGRAGYPLLEAERDVFFCRVLAPDLKPENDPRLETDPWARWTQDPRGIDSVELARRPSVAETWGLWRAQHACEVLEESWPEIGLSSGGPKPRF